MVISNADQSNYARKFVTNSTQIASDKHTNKHTHIQICTNALRFTQFRCTQF